MKQLSLLKPETISNAYALMAQANRRLGSDGRTIREESALFDDCFERLSPLNIPA